MLRVKSGKAKDEADTRTREDLVESSTELLGMLYALAMLLDGLAENAFELENPADIARDIRSVIRRAGFAPPPSFRDALDEAFGRISGHDH